jgi:hypothetical protein
MTIAKMAVEKGENRRTIKIPNRLRVNGARRFGSTLIAKKNGTTQIAATTQKERNVEIPIQGPESGRKKQYENDKQERLDKPGVPEFHNAARLFCQLRESRNSLVDYG